MKNMQEDRNRKLAQEKLAQDNIDNGLNAGIATAQQNMMNQKRKKMPGLNEMSAFTGGNNNGVV